jgi:hypothetical protein
MVIWCPGRQAGLILKAFADGADSKNAYVVVNSPEDVPAPRCQTNGHQLFSCSAVPSTHKTEVN